MTRSEILTADLERIRSMSDEEFHAEWGRWARLRDKDWRLVRERWISDMEYQLSFALVEEQAAANLVAAKDAYRADPTPITREAKAEAVRVISIIRAEERSSRTDPLTGQLVMVLGGDTWAGVK